MKYNKQRFIVGLLPLLLLALLACSPVAKKQSAQLKQAKGMYQKAQEQYRNGDFAGAQSGYKKCIDFCKQDAYLEDDSIMEMLPVAMVQLMNAYQAAGQTEECIQAFKEMGQEASVKPSEHEAARGGEPLRLYARDIQVLYAYSLSRTDREEEAALAMDKALRQPLHNSTPDKLFRDYAYAAAVYYCVPKEQKRVFYYGQEALRQAKLMKKKAGVQWLVALMGGLYERTGEIYKAIQMYEEGIDISSHVKDTLAMADLNKSLANFLLSWDMLEEADAHSKASVDLIDSLSVSNPMVSTTAYVTRAQVLKRMHRNQQALDCLRKARKQCKDMPYNSGPSDVDVLEGTILVQDSMRMIEGLNMLKKAAGQATYGIQATAYEEMAKFYISKGYPKAGEIALDSMFAILNAPTHPLLREDAYEYAMSHYLETNNAEKVLQYGKVIQKIKNVTKDKEMLKLMSRSLVRLEMEQKNEQLRRQADLIRQRTLLYIVSIVLVLSFFVMVVLLFVQKRKSYRLKQRFMSEQLDETQRDLEQKNKDNRKIEKMLRVMERPIEEKVKMGVNLEEILMQKGEEQFRKLFNRSYPYFLPMLQQAALAPLTSREIIGSMLIALKKSNGEISNLLHMTRKSVNMSKYRMRKKFELNDGVTLEKYILGIFDEAKGKQTVDC